MKFKGCAWVFGDNIDTDQIISTQYYILNDMREMAKHAMEVVMPSFAFSVKHGDILVAGKIFGCGSSREQAPQVLKELGISVIVADSFARIFFRNCINIGLPVFESFGISSKIKNGDILEVDISEGVLTNLTDGNVYSGLKLPNFLLEILKNGGLLEYALKTEI